MNELVKNKIHELIEDILIIFFSTMRIKTLSGLTSILLSLFVIVSAFCKLQLQY